MSLVKGRKPRKGGPLRADAKMVDEIWDGTKRNRGKNFRDPCAWGRGRDGALGDMGESQVCGHRCSGTGLIELSFGGSPPCITRRIVRHLVEGVGRRHVLAVCGMTSTGKAPTVRKAHRQ